MKRSLFVVALGSLAFSAAIAFSLPADAGVADADPTPNHDTMMQHGSEVMPFDQKSAMHMFTPSATGGSVEVMVHNMDAKQMALVRSHLRAEAAKFAAGDFSDPAYIHGKTMPGLALLSAAGARLQVAYADTEMGGEIVFTTSDPAVVDAVHAWLAAQNKDHNESGGS